MAIRCADCGSASHGFPACPICGHELPAPVRVERLPEAPSQPSPVLGFLGSLVTLAVSLVLCGISVMLVGISLRPDQPADVLGPAATSTVPTATPTPSPTPSSPTATPSRTPTPKPVVVRRCWNGARVTGTKQCAAPIGVQGLAAASTSFASARRDRRCRPLPRNPVIKGYVCSVRGAPVRFAWFASTKTLRGYTVRTYATCRSVGYVRICGGRERQGKRYADQRFRLEISAPRADRKVLLAVPLTPAARMLRGTVVS